MGDGTGLKMTLTETGLFYVTGRSTVYKTGAALEHEHTDYSVMLPPVLCAYRRLAKARHFPTRGPNLRRTDFPMTPATIYSLH